MAENIAHFTDAHTVLQRYVAEVRERLFVPKQIEREEEWHISIAELATLDPQLFLLYELFRPYGFSEAVLADLAAVLHGVSGRQFFSPSHVLYLDRQSVIMRRSEPFKPDVATLGEADESVCWGDGRFETGWSTDTMVRVDPHMAQFDGDRIRSEEPTDELQSLMRISYDVFGLEKTSILQTNIHRS